MACAAVPRRRSQPRAVPKVRRAAEAGTAWRRHEQVTTEWIASGPALSWGTPPVTLPAYCRVQAAESPAGERMASRTGIGFALALPATWNGRFLFQEAVDSTGFSLPLGLGAAGGMPALARGFAVASTDSGHQSPPGTFLDTTFLRDQQATLDFAYPAVDRVTAVAKAIIAQHYRPVSRSYYSGCSTGGREAMQAAQRHRWSSTASSRGASDANNYAALGTDWVNVQLNQVAPRDANGQPVTRDALSSTQKQAVIDGIRNSCDANDGVRDGLVFNASLQVRSENTRVRREVEWRQLLTAAQAAALERAFAGPRTGGGRQLYSPFPFDTGIADPTPGIPGLLHGGFTGLQRRPRIWRPRRAGPIRTGRQR